MLTVVTIHYHYKCFAPLYLFKKNVNNDVTFITVYLSLSFIKMKFIDKYLRLHRLYYIN